MDVPIQVDCAVYDLAESRMLVSNNDFIDYCIDRLNLNTFIPIQSTEILFKPEWKEHCLQHEYKRFPDESTPGLKRITRERQGNLK